MVNNTKKKNGDFKKNRKKQQLLSSHYLYNFEIKVKTNIQK